MPKVGDDFERHLNVSEIQFLKGMKRKERGDLQRVCHTFKSNATPIRIKVLQSNLPDGIKMQLFDALALNVSDKYMQWCTTMLRMPIGVVHPTAARNAQIGVALMRAKAAMDAAIVGQEDAKRETLKLVQQAITNPGEPPSAYALGFEGKPGCGKTLFVQKAMQAALGVPVVSIPLGGATDGSAYLWGHGYSYEGSKEGRLAGGLIEVGCCNPIIHLDEVDKVYDRERGGAEIISSLIHLLDPSCNGALRDRYLHGLDIDFGKCTFVLTYNDAARINPILLNRLKRVKFHEPSHEEKRLILSQQLLPRIQRRLNTAMTIDESSANLLLEASKGDAGLRELERNVDHVLSCASLDKAMINDARKNGVITEAEVQEYMKSQWRDEACPPPFGMYN